MKKRSICRRLLFIAITLAVTIGALEVSAAFAYRVVTGTWFSYTEVERMQREAALVEDAPEETDSAERDFNVLLTHMYHTPHPYLGFVYTKDFNKPEFARVRAQYAVSDFGFVDDKPPIQKRSPDKVIIGIVGGSVALGFGMEGTPTLGRLLAAHPRFAGREPVFVRMGLGGYKQPQQLMAITYMLAQGAEFDVVINLDGFNEVALPAVDNVPSGTYPYFPRGWRYILGQSLSREQKAAIGKRTYLESARVDLARSFLDMPARYSVVLQLIWRMRDEALRREVAVATDEARAASPDHPPFAVTGPGVAGFTVDNLFERLARFWHDSSVQLGRLCASNGITYVHALQPNQYVPGSKPMHEDEVRVALDHSTGYAESVKLGYPYLIAQGRRLRSAGIEFRDLTRCFAEHSEQLYVDPCCHLNTRGNEIIAAAIAEAVCAATDRSDFRRGEVVGLAALPARIVLTDPFGSTPLLLHATFKDGGVRDFAAGTVADLIVADDPGLVAIDGSAVTARRCGHTTIRIQGAGVDVRVPVEVAIPHVLGFGAGLAGTGGYVPVLEGTVEPGSRGARVVLSGRRALGGTQAALLLARVPLRTSGPGLLVGTKASGFQTTCTGEAGKAGAGTARFEVALPRDVAGAGAVAYCQALFRDPASATGFSVSNAVRIELE